MEWIEADPLPRECENCQEEECYNCDYAGKRWYLSQVDQIKLRRKVLLRAIERQKSQITAIEKELVKKYGVTEF